MLQVSRENIRQVFSYGVIGVFSNALLYCLFVLITWLGVEPKLAMSIGWVIGITQSYFLNRRFTFSLKGQDLTSFIKYVTTYLLNYCINWIALYIFVDHQGHSHLIVQAIMVFVNAAIIFLMLRVWVFRSNPDAMATVPRE